jgi:hypothetical protein
MLSVGFLMRNRLPEREKKGYQQDFDPTSGWSKTLKHVRILAMNTSNYIETRGKYGLLNPFVLACCALIASTLTALPAYALPADFVGRYEILDSRLLSVSGGAAYVIQDGQLVVEISRNRNRPYCRALQSFFDESQGAIDVRYSIMADSTERAVLKTIPAVRGAAPTTIECYAEQGFFGSLDLSIALGKIVDLVK